MKITDKQRLDWLFTAGVIWEISERECTITVGKAGPEDAIFTRRTPRAAIDAAIRQSRKEGGK